MKTIEVHISEIRHGDTIIHNGDIITVGRKWIKYDSFMGITLFGDSYNLGRKKVIKIIEF